VENVLRGWLSSGSLFVGHGFFDLLILHESGLRMDVLPARRGLVLDW
jgi:hypothetical protein